MAKHATVQMYDAMNSFLMQAEMLELEGLQNSKQSQLALFQEEMAKLEEDVDVPLRLKQGQVEVQPQGLVDSSLDHAVLLSQQLVQVGLLHSPSPPWASLPFLAFPPLPTLLTFPLSASTLTAASSQLTGACFCPSKWTCWTQEWATEA